MVVRPGRLVTPNLRNWSQPKGRWERIMVGVTKDIKSTNWIQKQSGVTDIIRSIRESKHRWTRHMARRSDNRWTIRVTEWIPRGHKRPRGRPRTRWCNNFIRYVGSTTLRKTGSCGEHVERGSSQILRERETP